MERDRLYDDPELTRFYDLENGWADDTDYCFNLAREAGSVLDLGCGTGLFAASVAVGRRVAGVDPAAAMLDIARRRAGGELVNWVEADAREVRLGGEQFDLIVLTGHAFQVFLSDSDQLAVCRTIAAHLKPGGQFIFDTRNPSAREWEEWTPERSRRRLRHPELAEVEAWNDVTYDDAVSVATYGTYYRAGAEVWSARSRIRFTPQPEIAGRLEETGLEAVQWLGDWKGNDFTPDSAEIIPMGGIRR